MKSSVVKAGKLLDLVRAGKSMIHLILATVNYPEVQEKVHQMLKRFSPRCFPYV